MSIPKPIERFVRVTHVNPQSIPANLLHTANNSNNIGARRPPTIKVPVPSVSCTPFLRAECLRFRNLPEESLAFYINSSRWAAGEARMGNPTPEMSAGQSIIERRDFLQNTATNWLKLEDGNDLSLTNAGSSICSNGTFLAPY